MLDFNNLQSGTLDTLRKKNLFSNITKDTRPTIACNALRGGNDLPWRGFQPRIEPIIVWFESNITALPVDQQQA